MYLRYRFERRALTTAVVALLSLFLFNNCDGSFTVKKFSDSSAPSAAEGIGNTCGESQNAAPNSIDEIVVLINQLPKPLTVACFLSHLRKPLHVYAVDNVFSAQPSQGPDNPRIFIFSGNLNISVVPLGPGRDVVEFSEFTQGSSGASSVKGEIPFPIVDQIASSAPYSRILEGAGRTNCGVCHQPETRALNITTGEAYNSGVLQPNPINRIRANRLLFAAQQCDPKKDAERCDILKSIFVDGNAQDQNFPYTPQ